MVNPQLIDYIKKQESRGYSSQQLYYTLIQNGYNPQEVNEAMNLVGKRSRISSADLLHMNKKTLIIIISLLAIVVVALGLIWFFRRPVCGNDKLDKGETPETCCLDAGCLGEQRCVDNYCIEPTCGECQYIENHICLDYICCSDQDCNDEIEHTEDKCKDPSTKNSKCLNSPKAEIGDVEKKVSMGQDDSLYIEINDENHIIEVEEVTENSATIAVYSEPRKITLIIGEALEIDVDEDNKNDIYIELVDIVNNDAVFEIKSLEKTNRFSLDIELQKSSYQMGEPIQGDYKIEYSGDPFEGIILYTYSREGFETKYYSILQSQITADTENKLAFRPFRLDETGYVASTDFFYDEGTYDYTVSIYSCEMVESSLSKDCSVAKGKELETLVPLKTITEKIIIQGGVSPSECRKEQDCTEICEGCVAGTQICEMTDEKCMDCFADSQCKQGYRCIQETCVAWECDSNLDCNDDEASTKDVCTNFLCSHSLITECEDNDLYCPEGCDEESDNDCGDKCGSELVDCGTAELSEDMPGNTPELDCFLENAGGCCPAKMVYEIEMVFEGMILLTETYREIIGLEDDRCVVFQRMDQATYSLSEEDRQEMLDGGMTEEEIEQELASYNNFVEDHMTGKDVTCRYPISDYVFILEDEKQGNFLLFPEDANEYQCTGSYFEQGPD